MSQVCGKMQNLEDLGFITQSILNYLDRYGNNIQGDLGEKAANVYAVNELHLHEENFDKQIHGFDCVFRDGSGKLVIGEAKATRTSGLNALANTNHGKEGSVEWVEYKAQMMCDPLSSLYSPANCKIGEEILRVGAKNVEFIVIHMHPETLNVDVTNLR